MKLLLMNTVTGLKPMYDEDMEEKKMLKVGEVYEANIKPPRNLLFHRKLFALVNTAWEYLPEKGVSFFRTKEAFRNYLTICAGYTETFYSPAKQEWLEMPKSWAFDSMDEAEFSKLYDGIKGVVFWLIGDTITEEEFMKNLINF